MASSVFILTQSVLAVKSLVAIRAAHEQKIGSPSKLVHVFEVTFPKFFTAITVTHGKFKQTDHLSAVILICLGYAGQAYNGNQAVVSLSPGFLIVTGSCRKTGLLYVLLSKIVQNPKSHFITCSHGEFRYCF